MRERGTGILDYKKGTRYLKSSGILLREQSVDPASLYAAASAVAGMFGLSKKEELAERFCRAAYDGAYREAYLLILLLYWNKVQHKCGGNHRRLQKKRTENNEYFRTKMYILLAINMEMLHLCCTKR